MCVSFVRFIFRWKWCTQGHNHNMADENPGSIYLKSIYFLQTWAFLHTFLIMTWKETKWKKKCNKKFVKTFENLTHFIRKTGSSFLSTSFGYYDSCCCCWWWYRAAIAVRNIYTYQTISYSNHIKDELLVPGAIPSTVNITWLCICIRIYNVIILSVISFAAHFKPYFCFVSLTSSFLCFAFKNYCFSIGFCET